MKVIYKYYKNSNTGFLMKTQEFIETPIKGIPVYFYNLNGEKIGENLDLDGFVEISEKKFKRVQRKNKKL